MQKAGTGFLHECLNSLEAFQLPLRREIHHFDGRGKPHPGNLRYLRKVARQLGAESDDPAHLETFFRSLRPRWFRRQKFRAGRSRHRLDAVTAEFLRKFSTYLAHGAGDREYLDLFTPYRSRITGDITPGYSTLSREEVERVHELLPEVKLILSVRDPVERLWSQLNMGARRAFKAEFGRPPGEDDRQVFEQFLEPDKISATIAEDWYSSRSRASDILQTWESVYGSDRILLISFEDLIGASGEVLDRICTFLGVTPQPEKTIPANRKQGAMKTRLDDERREILQAALADELANFTAMMRRAGR